MKKLLLSILTVFTFLFTSCIENSTVIKVKKDGTGIVHIRNYSNSDAGGMLGALGGGDTEEGESEVDTPSEEELQAMATKMGEGVSFKSIKTGKNESGWDGYELIFEYEDINNLKISLDTDAISEQIGETAETGEEKEPEFATFEMTDGTLVIRTPFDETNADAEEESEEEVEGESSNPFGGEGPSDMDPAMLAMVAPMFQGAKLGVFIEVEGEIEETNALHRKDNLITIVKMDLSKVITNPNAMSQMENMESGSREDAQAVADKIDGLDMDVQEEIKVTFK